MVIGTLIVYAIGVPVLAIVLGLPFADALQVGALVFLPWDLAKVVLAAWLLPYAWRVAGERDWTALIIPPAVPPRPPALAASRVGAAREAPASRPP